MFQQKPKRPFGPCRGQSLWMKVRWCPCWFHHRPTVRSSHTPSTSGHRCQGWRRCAYVQQKPQQPFDQYRGQSLWMKVRWCPCWFHHRPTVLCCHAPSTSGHRCQEWRRCGDFSIPYRNGCAARAEVDRCGWRCVGVRVGSHHCPTVRSSHTPSTSGHRCQGWRRCGMLQQTIVVRISKGRGTRRATA